MSFFLTEHVGYRLGAVLAVVLGVAGFSANAVTLSALLLSVGGTAASIYLLEGAMLQALGIFLSMGIGYALDCADGMMARVQGEESVFGAIFDKVSDLISMVVCMALVAGAAADKGWGNGVLLLVFGAAMSARLGLSVAIWLNEFVGSPPDRGAEDHRERNLQWYLRRGIGSITDHVLFVVLLAGSFATGTFWEFFVIYHTGVGLVLIAYLIKLSREAGVGSNRLLR